MQLSLRDRKRGGAPLRPLRSPDSELKKLRYAMLRSASACCSTTEETSDSHARSEVSLAAVIRFDSSPSDGYFSPFSRAVCRARSPSLNTTRAPERLRQRLTLGRLRVESEVVTELHPNSLSTSSSWSA
jgi:hypothetical protein